MTPDTTAISERSDGLPVRPFCDPFMLRSICDPFGRTGRPSYGVLAKRSKKRRSETLTSDLDSELRFSFFDN
jgi:hypothetical protein